MLHDISTDAHVNSENDVTLIASISNGAIFDKHANSERTSDGGNGNHSVSLPIILIKIKIDQMLPSSYICCWSIFYDFAFDFLFP